MQLIRRALCASAVLLAATCGQAYAGDGGGTSGGGSAGGTCSFPTVVISGQTVTSAVRCTASGHGGYTGGAINWTPPTCWWEPKYTAAEFLQLYQSLKRVMVHDPDFQQLALQFENLYGPQLQQDDSKGKWYEWVCNDNATQDEWNNNGVPGGWPWKWVNNGVASIGGQRVLTTETLAEIAASTLRIPDTKVQMNPAPGTPSTVNLPTWFWAPAGRYKQVSATASLPTFGMSATVTARAVGLTISASGPYAQTSPSPLSCTINADGSVGTRWNGQTGSSNCSMLFLHATLNSPDQLTATVTWSVDFTGSGAGWPKTVVVTQNQQITVQEVQSIVTH